LPCHIASQLVVGAEDTFAVEGGIPSRSTEEEVVGKNLFAAEIAIVVEG